VGEGVRRFSDVQDLTGNAVVVAPRSLSDYSEENLKELSPLKLGNLGVC
jgi:hypothetical protein